MSDEVLKKKLALAFQDKYNFVMVVGQKEAESGSVTIQGRSLAAYDGVTEKPEAYKKSMKVEEVIEFFRKLQTERTAV